MFQNFIYNGIPNDYYDVIAVFVAKNINGVNSAGMHTNTETLASKKNGLFSIVQQNYDEPMAFTIQLVNKDFTPIDKEKERALKKWLCKRGKYHWLQLCEDGFEDLFMMANFSNPRFIYYGNIWGLEFDIATNAPYAFSPLIRETFEITGGSRTKTIYVNTDEEGCLYPSVKITMKESGALTIANSAEAPHREFVIEGLTTGEVISIDGSLPDITSSQNGRNIYQSFNKHWLRLADGKNTLSFNKNCAFEIEYREIRKVGVFS